MDFTSLSNYVIKNSTFPVPSETNLPDKQLRDNKVNLHYDFKKERTRFEAEPL